MGTQPIPLSIFCQGSKRPPPVSQPVIDLAVLLDMERAGTLSKVRSVRPDRDGGFWHFQRNHPHDVTVLFGPRGATITVRNNQDKFIDDLRAYGVLLNSAGTGR
jgi:hypothetical protein